MLLSKFDEIGLLFATAILDDLAVQDKVLMQSCGALNS